MLTGAWERHIVDFAVNPCNSAGRDYFNLLPRMNQEQIVAWVTGEIERRGLVDPKNKLVSLRAAIAEALPDHPLHQIIRVCFVEALRMTEGNKAQAAQLLDVTRQTVRNRIRVDDIRAEEFLPEGD